MHITPDWESYCVLIAKQDGSVSLTTRPENNEKMWTPLKNKDGSWSFQSVYGGWLSAHTNGTINTVLNSTESSKNFVLESRKGILRSICYLLERFLSEFGYYSFQYSFNKVRIITTNMFKDICLSGQRYRGRGTPLYQVMAQYLSSKQENWERLARVLRLGLVFDLQRKGILEHQTSL